MLEKIEKEYLEAISREKSVPATSSMPGTSTQRPPQINPLMPLIETSSLARDFRASRERSSSQKPGPSSEVLAAVSPKRPADNGTKSPKKRKSEEKKKQQPPQSKTNIRSFFNNKKKF